MIESERESQLSAMFDGELTAAECELVARRLAKDESLRRSWEHYSLIGAVLREEPIARRQLAPRVQEGLQVEAQAGVAAAVDHVGASAQTTTRSRWLAPLAGAGVAAALSAVAFVLLQRPEPAAAPMLLADAASSEAPVEEVVIPAAGNGNVELVLARRSVRNENGATAEATAGGSPRGVEPESYVTPPYNPAVQGPLAAPVQLANFVVAHSAVAAPMLRHGMLSSFITAAPAQETADQVSENTPPLERESRADSLREESLRGDLL
jgi:sigma-E factor negative regulatory protein RseA